MSAFDMLFGSPFGCTTDPGAMRAMSEQEWNAYALLTAPLTMQAKQTGYEALRNAFRSYEDQQMTTLDERYRDFCGRLQLAIERHHAHSNS